MEIGVPFFVFMVLDYIFIADIMKIEGDEL